MGQSGLELYLWAICSSTMPFGKFDEKDLFPYYETPALILHTEEGNIEAVKIPGAGTYYARDIRAMFPVDVQERIFNRLIDTRSLSEHLDFRREHSEVPPLIVLEATLVP
ncbi:MAG: hypothetical protein JW771_05355 [Candidatus Thermoplasmatota archaeon]|nr:hypothetical protein [Candidatus Thermoplasmatota archaeon]